MTRNKHKTSGSGRQTALLALYAAATMGLLQAPALAQQSAPAATGSRAQAQGTPPESSDTVPIAQGAPRPVGVNVNVSDQDLLNAPQNTSDWLLYGRTYDNQRFSPLTAITSSNVKRLTPVAIIQTGVANSFEDSPIEVNGVLFIATPDDHVQAYDATTGKQL